MKKNEQNTGKLESYLYKKLAKATMKAAQQGSGDWPWCIGPSYQPAHPKKQEQSK